MQYNDIINCYLNVNKNFKKLLRYNKNIKNNLNNLKKIKNKCKRETIYLKSSMIKSNVVIEKLYAINHMGKT